jgi:pilus assembly protein CpaB
MSLRAIIVVVLALICGGMAVLGVRQLAGSANGNVPPETTAIVTAKQEIARGTVVSADMLTTQAWPKELAPSNALPAIEECVGRASLAPILVGEPILEGKLASKDSGRGLAALVPKGMRAYTIQTSRDASNVAGFVLPGNRVDVLLTLTGCAQDETGGGSTVTLLQAVEILAVAQRLDAPADNKVDPKEMRSVTLLVTPDQAAVLDLGQNMGKLTLSLRNPEDLVDATPEPATLRLLRFLQTGPVDPDAQGGDQTATDSGDAALRKEQPERFEIRTLRGGHAGRVYVSSAR